MILRAAFHPSNSGRKRGGGLETRGGTTNGWMARLLKFSSMNPSEQQPVEYKNVEYDTVLTLEVDYFLVIPTPRIKENFSEI